MIEFNYVPTPKQRIFHETTAREVLYGGAAGGGKSYAIVWDALVRCLTYPKTKAYLFRRTYPELEQTLIATAREIIPESLGKYKASEHKFVLVNGSQMYFCYMQFEADRLKYLGAEIQWLYFDELTSFTQDMYNFIRSRLRAPKHLNVTPVIRCASNPGGPGHGWVKAYFVDPTDIGKKVIKHKIEFYDENTKTTQTKIFTTQYIPATVLDNPHISDDYKFELMMKPPKIRDAYLYGKWDAFEGQAFPEFTNDPDHYLDRMWTHVIEPFDIPYWWEHYISFDHGYSRPFSFGAFAVDPTGTVYRYKELYGCKPNEPNHGLMLAPSGIGKMLDEWLQPEFREGIRFHGIADPAVFDKSRGESVADQLLKYFNGVYFSPGDNTRLAGKNNFHEYLKFDQTGHPKLYVFNTCKDFIRTIPSLVYDDHKVEDIDTEGEDHIYDETRYMLMDRPLTPRQSFPKPKKDWSPYEEVRRKR